MMYQFHDKNEGVYLRSWLLSAGFASAYPLHSWMLKDKLEEKLLYISKIL